MIVHGGIELYPYPTPRMVSLYLWFIDLGADVVINHHQHCYSGYESYKKGLFFMVWFFCFDWIGKRKSDWNDGYMVRLSFEEDKPLSETFEIIPYIQCDDIPGIRLMTNEENRRFKSKLGIINQTFPMIKH